MQNLYTELFHKLWDDYVAITPDALKVHNEFSSLSSNPIVNDHIALRTFNDGLINLKHIGKFLAQHGYAEAGEYHFEEKKLYAKHFAHQSDAMAPKVFVSELLLEEFSAELQMFCRGLIAQANWQISQEGLQIPNRHWGKISRNAYERLLEESEYAAWLAAFGLRANHFTVSINHLESLKDIESVNQFVKTAGFKLNTSGSEIKGSQKVGLKQSSTMANSLDWAFEDGNYPIRSCFYEFAERFPMANGELYQGFVAASADKIFESTNVAA
ncbi:DUF1338 domain-containing protein [Kangiella sp. TOML190]|uniref:DUF1338 domain-containing protein n=1 Tax=Kangiella sp. TOML190 TaxID=2931351 RepID=UPI00203DA074|nr:DUF1338 domain-containing protein [Kangiella sp. TOML190]